MAHQLRRPLAARRPAAGIGAAVGAVLAIGSSLADAPPAAPTDGKGLYAAHCLACHQADGQGVPFMQPPLVGSAWLRSDPEALASFVLSGGFNSGERKQSRNANTMPSFAALDDASLAALLTYVRATFGDNAAPVSAHDVGAARRRLPP
jgi:mono/diheme cytochrome c family protein